MTRGARKADAAFASAGYSRKLLGDVLMDVKSGFASGDDLQDGIFQIRMNNITRAGQLDLTKRRRVPAEGKKVSGFLLRPGDVLFNATNSPELVGKSAYFEDPEEPTVFSNHFLRLRAKKDILDSRYLARWLGAQFERGFFRHLAHRWVNQATVPREVLLGLEIRIPPLDEQRRIAEVLDRADALHAKRRAVSDQLYSLKRSIFVQMFGAAHEHFPLITVKDVARDQPGSLRTGPFGSDLLHSEFVSEGVPVLGIDNVVTNEFRWGERRYITWGKYQKLKRYAVSPGDVLISIMGTCGHCVVVPHDIGTAINTKHLCCISPDAEKCFPEFLQAYFLWHPLARRYLTRTSKGAIMSGLNLSIIRNMPIPLIPLAEQGYFLNRVRVADGTRRLSSLAGSHHEELFRAVQSRAFAGAM